MKGKVYLVGAGPGDYKLITVKGMEAIKKADVLVYDRLVNDKYLKEVKENCEMIYVGKKSADHTMDQEDINKLLAAKAGEGKVVTRLKGGDPYVFGRGGEEGEYLYDKGIDFEVIPGITSAIGGLCYAGIPITHREYASSFHVFTGHLKDEKNDIDWQAVSSLNGTLVFLMGMSNLKNIVEQLMANGKKSSTPIAIINWATTYKQKVLTGTLQNIYEKVQSEKVQSPSLVVIGEVVTLRDRLNFFGKKSLFGKNIIVTRSRAQNSTLVEHIEQLGGNAIEIPTIRISKIEPNEDLVTAIKHMREYTYIIFTSINAVNIFFEKLLELGYDCRILANAKIVAIGKATSKALHLYGIRADIIPEKYISEAIMDALQNRIEKKDRILIPRAKEARSYLVDALREICSVNEVAIYETLKDDSEKNRILELLHNEKIDYITFTSSSTVKNFIAMLDAENLPLLKNIKLISIGPVTSETIRQYGLHVYKEAAEYNIEGIIKCIQNDIEEA